MLELYHIVNRGVDKRKIFLEDKDYLRFIHNLFEFNDEDYVEDSYRKGILNSKIGRAEFEERKKRKILVYIHCFSLMPNHYHLLISPLKQNSIPKFMHKLNKGYSRYFNEKYKRRGTLFESGYKSILVTKEPHFIYLPYYIHLNPLDFKTPEWRKGELSDYQKAIKFLENYRWSSHLDYLGKKNFPSVTYRDFLLDFFKGPEGYKNSIYNWLKDFNLATIKPLILEEI